MTNASTPQHLFLVPACDEPAQGRSDRDPGVADRAPVRPPCDGATTDRAPVRPPCDRATADRAPVRPPCDRATADRAPVRLASDGATADRAPVRPIRPRRSTGTAPESSAAEGASPAKRWEAAPDETCAAAFDALRPLREALAPGDVASVNLDLLRAARIVLTALPRIAELRPELGTLTGLDLEAIDGLRTRALATLHAHASAGPRSPRSSGLFAEAKELRRQLLTCMNSLANAWNLVDPRILERMTSGRTARDVSDDLLRCVHALRSKWEDLEGKTPLRLDDLRQADRTATALMMESGDQRARTRAERHDDRARALTLLLRAYDEARRGVLFLRWHHGDAAEITPSLYAGSGGGRRRTR